MLKLLILLLLAPAAWAAEDKPLDWTRKGYYVATYEGAAIECRKADGTFGPSQHTNPMDASECAGLHAKRNGLTGKVYYDIRGPNYEFMVFMPQPDDTFEPPPPPPVDTGEMLDPNTVFACDGGENGTTSEPTGSDSNSGLWVDGQPDPVKSLRRLEQIAEAQPDGVDYRLCEGAVFEDQTLMIRKSGDVGAYNRNLIAGADAKTKRIKNYRSLDGWRREDEDYVVVGCYKILNGVPRPCMDSYPKCEPGVAVKCLDPLDYSLRSHWQG